MGVKGEEGKEATDRNRIGMSTYAPKRCCVFLNVRKEKWALFKISTCQGSREIFSKKAFSFVMILGSFHLLHSRTKWLSYRRSDKITGFSRFTRLRFVSSTRPSVFVTKSIRKPLLIYKKIEKRRRRCIMFRKLALH